MAVNGRPVAELGAITAVCDAALNDAGAVYLTLAVTPVVLTVRASATASDLRASFRCLTSRVCR